MHTGTQLPGYVQAIGPYLSSLAFYFRKHTVLLSPFVFFIPFVNFKTTIIMADLTNNKPEIMCIKKREEQGWPVSSAG